MSNNDDDSVRGELIGSLLVNFPDEGFSLTMTVVDLGEDHYVLLGVPIASETFSIGDTVLAQLQEDGVLKVLNKVEESDWRTSFYYVPTSLVETGAIETVFARVEALGGYYQQVFGGLLFICLPPGVEYDAADELVEK